MYVIKYKKILHQKISVDELKITLLAARENLFKKRYAAMIRFRSVCIRNKEAILILIIIFDI